MKITSAARTHGRAHHHARSGATRLDSGRPVVRDDAQCLRKHRRRPASKRQQRSASLRARSATSRGVQCTQNVAQHRATGAAVMRDQRPISSPSVDQRAQDTASVRASHACKLSIGARLPCATIAHVARVHARDMEGRRRVRRRPGGRLSIFIVVDYRQSGPRPDPRLLRQAALEALTRSARTNTPRKTRPEQFPAKIVGGGGGAWAAAAAA
ncbi:hypothetical protein F511_31315 [Dorcoceras hygrometricum]|uniref:Uncharacterized protein n=1 Tax=Dorcoceras hygrometricum TaxID=472368 RepID=A0A2Z7D5I8_9LAMI|nr:hypothetical protein F511_31315 [Dorcoceras hygrometricum]